MESKVARRSAAAVMKRRRIISATSTSLKKIELKHRGLSLYAETERTGGRERLEE